MISLSGTLIITQINGKYGAFNKAKLTTSIGSFTIKDKRIEQYEEGKYEGTFVIVEIKPYSYLYQNRASYEIQARLNDMVLNDNTLLTDEDKSSTAMSEHDPASDEQKPTERNQCHVNKSKQDSIINDSDARKSAEYDLIKLREVINNLPMGADANYTHFVIIPNYDVDVDNVVVGDINTFSVKALSNNEPVEVAQFDTFTDAEMAIEKWRKEVEENNQTKFL